MAVDTAVKRASALGYARVWDLMIPDSTIGQNDRQTIAGLYGGIAASSPDTGTPYHWNGPYTRVMD